MPRFRPDGETALAGFFAVASHEAYLLKLDRRTSKGDMPMPNLSILAVTNSCEQVETLVSILALEGWMTRRVSTCREAIAHLEEYPTGLVLRERRLSDGTWRTVLEAIQTMQDAPLLVAFSHCGEEPLCAEPLNLSGYEVRVKRFDPCEVRRTVAAALQRSEALARAADTGAC
jgi:DNA-binding NtrC family response regulator